MLSDCKAQASPEDGDYHASSGTGQYGWVASHSYGWFDFTGSMCSMM